MDVGNLARRGAAGIDHDDLGAAPLAGCDQPLIQHRMAPCEVRADQHHEVGHLQILVGAGHRIGPERTLVTGHRRRHAQPRVGVDVGRADEALHQLVGDVVVLGEQLTGDVERDGVGPMLGDRIRKAAGDQIECCIPACTLAADQGMQQSIIERQRLAECRAFRAQPPEIGGMLGIAGDGNRPIAGRRRHHAATDAAIRTTRLDRGDVHHVVLKPRSGSRAGSRRAGCGRPRS